MLTKNAAKKAALYMLAPAFASSMAIKGAMAQQGADAIEEVIAIGTRMEGRTATESLVPVDVISEEAIQNSGAVDTADMLRKLAPSFNMNNTTTSDGQDLMRPATLRSMAADQVLVLVNGKRRHQQALVAVQENVGRGSAGTDLSSIPLSAIARVEILRDGAAAQYGSDAIAGVINIILKDHEGGNAWGQFRTTSENDGDTFKAGLHYGFEIGDGGYLNLTYEYIDQDMMNRADETNWYGASPVTDQLTLVGESDVESDAFWVNAGLPVGDGELYAFGGYTKKEGESLGFYRGPGDDRVWSSLFPNGVTPGLGTQTEDSSLALGYKVTLGEWDTDFSVAWGENRFEFRNTESLNASYGPNSPTEAYDGALVTEQLTLNVDGVRSIELSFAEEASLALGAEYREDGFKQEAGDEVSYARGSVWCAESSANAGSTNPADCVAAEYTTPGMQGFQGYSPEMEIDTDRESYAAYADVEMALTESLDMGFAVRYEDYSDFGDTTNFKLSTRYQITDELAARAAFSTGFRAPGMQQKNFTQRSISLQNGQLADLVTLRPDSSLAADFGFDELTEETSKSFSLGLVYTGETWTSTLDFYQIDIDDRIVYSGSICDGAVVAGCTSSAAVNAVFAANNGAGQLLDGVVNVSVFTNAVDTQTVGMDWVNEWAFDLDSGDNVVLEATLHLNNTTVEGINQASSLVSNDVVFGESSELLLTDGQPGERATLGATYNAESWSVTTRANYYGEVSTASYGTPKNTWGAKTLVDVTGTWDVTESVQVTAGILNLFDTYPDKWGDEAIASDGTDFRRLGFEYGWTSFPFSLAGREYYIRASINF
jgi:iron complex outermembrane receptor protein